MKRWSRVVALALSVLMPTMLLAQGQTTGSVTGVITTEAGAPVADAEVTLSGPAIQGDRVTRTNAAGQFNARLLPPGQYTATVTSPGLQPAVVSFRVLVGETVPLNVTLSPGEVLAEEIVVHGRTSPLQTPETRQSFDYTQEVEELPIQNRNINNIALNAPNTSFGPNAGQVAIAGAPAFDTVVLLDGAEISDPLFGAGTTVYLEDSIQEVQVLTTGISARYGRFQGGVINAITKSGGNEFTGTLRAELDNQSWNSQTPFDENQTDDLNQTYQGTLGGYIIPDRIWFFGGYRTIPATSTSFTTKRTGETYTTTSTEDRWQFKLRGAITPSHTVDVSYLEFDGATVNRAGLPAGDLLAASGVRADPRTMKSATYQGVFGFNTFADAIATEKKAAISSGGDPAGGDPFLWRSPFMVFNNHWWDASDLIVRDNRTAAFNLSHSLDAGGFGSHLLQGGIQWVESHTGGDNRQSATGFNLDARTPKFNARMEGGQLLFDLHPDEVFRWVATDLRATQDITNTALYLQDTINWNAFRFDVGVRYDRYTGETTGLQSFGLDFGDFSPRVGVTYNMTPGLQVVGTYGRYVGRFNDNWGQDTSGVGSAPRVQDVYSGPVQTGLTAAEVQAILRNDAFWTFNTVFGDPGFPTAFMSRDATSPYANEWNLSLRSALPRNSGFVSATYTNREYKNLMTEFVGLACTDFGRCEGGDVTPVGGGRVVDAIVWDNDPRAVRDYNAVTLQADYRPTQRLTLGGNWTWSETQGNYEGEGRNTPASGSVLGRYERLIPTEAAAPYGYLNPDIRHRANAYGTYRFGFGRAGDLSTSAIVNYRTGRNWSRVASVPLGRIPEYASESGTYTHYFDGRNNNRFSDVWSLDFAARYALPLFGRVAPFVKVDVRNILDNDQLLSYQTTGTSAIVDGVRTWFPSGNADPRSKNFMPSCNPDSPDFEPSRQCTGFGKISSESNYQTPRTFLLTAGIQF